MMGYVTANNIKVQLQALPCFGNLHTVAEFKLAVRVGAIVDSDGFGQYATSVEYDFHGRFGDVKPSTIMAADLPEWATHIIWFNK